jgi:hypothetical protein
VGLQTHPRVRCDKGKPVVRRGRKAHGSLVEVAGLPKKEDPTCIG